MHLMLGTELAIINPKFPEVLRALANALAILASKENIK